MTWKDFRDAIEEAIEEKQVPPDKLEIWYFDKLVFELGRMEIHIDEKHHPGEYELWVD